MTMIQSATLNLAGTILRLATDAQAGDTLTVSTSAAIQLTVNGNTPISMPATRLIAGTEVNITFDQALRDQIFDDIGTTYRTDATFSLSLPAGSLTRNGMASTAQTVTINAGDRAANGNYTNTANVIGYPPIPRYVVVPFANLNATFAAPVLDFAGDFDRVNPNIGAQGSVNATIVNNSRTPAVTTTDPIMLTRIGIDNTGVDIGGVRGNFFGPITNYTETIPADLQRFNPTSNSDGVFVPSPHPSLFVSSETNQDTIQRTGTSRADTNLSFTIFGGQFAAFWSTAGRGYSGNLMLGNDRVFVHSFPELSTDAPTIAISGTERVGETLTATITDLDGVASPTYTWTRTDPITGMSTQATSSSSATYTLVADDIGTTLTVSAAYTNRRSGASETTPTSAPTGPIESMEATGILTAISSTGFLDRNTVLTAQVGGLADPNGLPTGNVYTLEWLRDGVVVQTIQNLNANLGGNSYRPTEPGTYQANLFFIDSANNREDIRSDNTIRLTMGDSGAIPSGTVGTGGRASFAGTKGPSRTAKKGLIPIRRR